MLIGAMSEPTDAELKQKLSKLEDGPSDEELENKSISEIMYPEGSITPADSGWELDEENDEVRINPVRGFTRRVDADTFFEVNSVYDPR